MKFYYTTTGEPNSDQSKPYLSLGGFRSGSLVPNDSFSNLFGELSTKVVTDDLPEYIGLMLHNDTGSDVTGVKLWFVIPENSYSIYRVAGVIPTTNGDGDKYIEEIPSKNSKPMYATFQSAGVGSELDIGDITADDVVGVWIQRELLQDFIKSDSEQCYEEDPSDPRRYISKELERSDSIEVNVSWD